MSASIEFDPDDMLSVASALRAYLRRCEAILTLLESKKSLAAWEREEVTTLYTSLKSDLTEAAKTGTLSGRKRPRTAAEEFVYEPAIRKAKIALREATNSNPIKSNWFSAVYDARLELSYTLHHMPGGPYPEA